MHSKLIQTFRVGDIIKFSHYTEPKVILFIDAASINHRTILRLVFGKLNDLYAYEDTWIEIEYIC